VFHFPRFLGRKAAVLALAAAPLGAGSSIFASAMIGTPAAHAAGTACIDINTSPPGSTGLGACPTTPSTTTLAAINVCTPLNTSNDGSGTGEPGTGVWTNPEGYVGVVEPPVDVWGNLLGGPTGQAEVGGVGIASQQTGC
jgi:hypothetical protein